MSRLWSGFHGRAVLALAVGLTLHWALPSQHLFDLVTPPGGGGPGYAAAVDDTQPGQLPRSHAVDVADTGPKLAGVAGGEFEARPGRTDCAEQRAAAARDAHSTAASVLSPPPRGFDARAPPVSV